MSVIKKKLPKPRVDGRGEKPKGKRPTAAQLVATHKVITIPLAKVGKVQQTSTLTTVERQRFEMLEAMLLKLRRAVAMVLVNGIDGNQDTLEEKAGELTAMLNIMEKRGDLRPGCLMKKCQDVADQLGEDIPKHCLQR